MAKNLFTRTVFVSPTRARCKAMKKETRKRVVLEPELEAIAGALSPFDRLWLAKKLRRWIRQLEVSARVLSAPPRRPGRRLPRQVARWN